MPHYEATLMSRFDWVCLGSFIIGFLLFLLGANIYNAIIGFLGIFLFIGAIVVYIAKYVYKELTKTSPPVPAPPAPVQNP